MIGGVHRAPVMIQETFHVESNEENLPQGVQMVVVYLSLHGDQIYLTLHGGRSAGSLCSGSCF